MFKLKNAASDFISVFNEPAQIIPLTSPTKILIVEDDKANQMVTSFWLEEFGYAYEIADNGEAAIKKFKTGRFSIVLMDVEMNGMNGFEATKSIREIEKSKNLKPSIVIAFTAHALLGDRKQCLEHGMDDYFSKPVNYPALQYCLSKHSTALANRHRH